MKAYYQHVLGGRGGSSSPRHLIINNGLKMILRSVFFVTLTVLLLAIIQRVNLVSAQEEDGAADCAFPPDDIVLYQNDTQQRLLFRSIINPTTQTISIELEYQGDDESAVWLGLAFVVRELMVPSTAVIGLPADDEPTVQKYDISSRSLSGVTAFTDSSTLTDTSISTSVTSSSSSSSSPPTTTTILRFTKPLAESMEQTVVTGENLINWAIGSSAVLGMHAHQGSTYVNVSECRSPAPPTMETPAPTRPPYTPAPFVTFPAGTLVDCSALDDNNDDNTAVTVSALGADGTTHAVTVRGILHPVELTVTMRVEYTKASSSEGVWIGFAFSTDGYMVPNTGAVIGIPGAPGVVEKYDLSVRDIVGVEPLRPIELQTLSNTSIVVVEPDEDGGSTTTIMQFTQLLSEPEQSVQVSAGVNQFIWAVGSSSTLTGTHIAKGAAFIELNVCTVVGEDANSSPTAASGGEPVVPSSPLPPVPSPVATSGNENGPGTFSLFTTCSTLGTAMTILLSTALCFAMVRY